MAINLEEHKVYIESLKMDMVPFTIAVQAINELSLNLSSSGYLEELNKAMEDLRTSLNNIKIDE